MSSSQTAAVSANQEAAPSNLVSISPFFIVKDLDTSIAHYVERFGFRVEFLGPEDGPYYGV